MARKSRSGRATLESGSNSGIAGLGYGYRGTRYSAAYRSGAGGSSFRAGAGSMACTRGNASPPYCRRSSGMGSSRSSRIMGCGRAGPAGVGLERCMTTVGAGRVPAVHARVSARIRAQRASTVRSLAAFPANRLIRRDDGSSYPFSRRDPVSSSSRSAPRRSRVLSTSFLSAASSGLLPARWSA